jgi:hypothetical protein
VNRKAALIAVALVIVGAAFAARATPAQAAHQGKASGTSALDKS